MAAAVSEAALCPGALDSDLEADARVSSMVEAIPNPNPLLYVYLLFAAAAVDRPDLAKRIISTPSTEQPDGAMADIHAALTASLASPAAFDGNRDRLERVIDGFFWDDAQRLAMMDKLEAVAAYRS
jgi:hypothetical protein